MADIHDPQSKPPLGVGRIVSQSFAILLRRFVLFFAIALAVQLLVLVFNRLFLPTAAMLDPATAASSAVIFATVSSGLLALIASSFTTGIIVLGAYDAWLGNPSRPAAYVGAALAAAVPLVVLSVVVNVTFVFGLALFIVPGLYIAAMWSVVAPAVVAEGAGFSALGRSMRLTADYRWAIVGLLIVTFAIVFGVSSILQFAVGSLFGVNPLAPAPAEIATMTSLPYQLFGAVIGAVSGAFTAVMAAVLFARLKEIKEGVGYEDLSTVFE